MSEPKKEYGLLMYVPGDREWRMSSERYEGTKVGIHDRTWGWWESDSYTSATAALQVLNNMLGWEVEAVWTQAVGYQDAELPHPMPVYLLSRPAEHAYDPDGPQDRHWHESEAGPH